MEERLLNSCSDSVKRAITHISSQLGDDPDFRVKYAPAYELLDCVDSEPSQQFLNKWSDDFTPGELPYEWVKSVVSLIKLERKHNRIQDSNRSSLNKLIKEMEKEQSIHGRILTNDMRHTGPLLCLVLFKPDATSTENALQYFLPQIDDMGFNPEYPRSRLAGGALALCYKDYDLYKSELKKIGERMNDCWTETAIDALRQDKSIRIAAAGMNLMALSKLPGDYQKIINQISSSLKESQHEDGYWSRENNVLDTSLAALGLVAVGEGPKITANSVEWQQELAKQRRKRSKPEFISTFPARASASHTAEIYEKAKTLITSADNKLRISSQYIDMLYEEIIDAIHENPELEVKILTRGRDVAGNRKRIKKGVLDELIEITEGNVCGNRRLHARMVIADQRAMIVSSADLTRDQLHDEFNGGIYTKDAEAVSEAINFFDEIWEESDRVPHS